ncbi:MAG: hypothetical protein PUE65_08000 [Mollicutes bacterium]|nr:hypothetical protein [Mollicutes bacterium]
MNLNGIDISKLMPESQSLINLYMNNKPHSKTISFNLINNQSFSDDDVARVMARYKKAFDELMANGIIKNYKAIRNDNVYTVTFVC